MAGLPDYSFGRRTPYHRALLNASSQKMYDVMLSTLKRGETSIQMGSDSCSFNVDVLKTILVGVLNDSPLLFWASGSIEVWTSGKTVSISMGVNDLYDDREDEIRRLEKRCSDIFRIVSGSCRSQYDISLALHDYLTDSVEYVDEGVRSHRALGPILDGKGVCEGIANAYSLLMNAFGVRCTKVDGHTRENADTGHSWNISVIGGHAYHTDVIFDLGGMHRFLNLNDDMMVLTHRFNRFVQCDSLDANYHHRNGTLFDTVEESDRYLRRIIGGRCFEFEFTVLEESSMEHYIESMRSMHKGGDVSVCMSEDGHGFLLSSRTGSGIIRRFMNYHRIDILS